MTRNERQVICKRVERLVSSGYGVVEACREIGISERSYYRWRSENSSVQA